MSDNISITPGTGDTVAADNVSGVKYQIIKIAIGADGSAALLGNANPLPIADAGGSLTVDGSVSIAAGENYLGRVGGTTRLISATLTRPADTTAYAAGDAVTDSTSAPTVLTFANAARVANGAGTIVAVTMVDSANQATAGQFELWLFDTTYTPDNDNSAYTPTDAECATLVGIVPLNLSYVGDATSGAGGNRVYVAANLSLPFQATGGGTSLFGALVVRNAYTPVSAELFVVRLRIYQD